MYNHLLCCKLLLCKTMPATAALQEQESKVNAFANLWATFGFHFPLLYQNKLASIYNFFLALVRKPEGY